MFHFYGPSPFPNINLIIMIMADISRQECQQGLCWGSKRLAPVLQPHTYTEKDRDTPWGSTLLLSDTLLRFTAHWSNPNSSKKTSSICWANQMKGELCTLLPPEPAELTLMCWDRRRTPQPEEMTKRKWDQCDTVFIILLCIPQPHLHLTILSRK